MKRIIKNLKKGMKGNRTKPKKSLKPNKMEVRIKEQAPTNYISRFFKW